MAAIFITESFRTSDKVHSLPHPLMMAVIEGDIPNGAMVVYREMSGAVRGGDRHETGSRRGWAVTSGWNGSFHAAHWVPVVWAWAKGSHRAGKARSMFRKIMRTVEAVDSSVARFEARRMVREGD